MSTSGQFTKCGVGKMLRGLKLCKKVIRI